MDIDVLSYHMGIGYDNIISKDYETSYTLLGVAANAADGSLGPTALTAFILT